jgi:protein associated with RNAse G/E
MTTRYTPGHRIPVLVQKADGAPYREFESCVVSHDEAKLVTFSSAGNLVRDHRKSDWRTWFHCRSVYFLDKPYNVLEIINIKTGLIEELYANVSNVPQLGASGLVWIDHELDVIRRIPGTAVKIDDEDEFEAAIMHYGYSSALQRQCRDAVDTLMQLLPAYEPEALDLAALMRMEKVSGGRLVRGPPPIGDVDPQRRNHRKGQRAIRQI